MKNQNNTFLFVGEQRSRTAIEKNWTWEDGRLAAKQLFDALTACGISPQDQEFANVFDDHGNIILSEILSDRVVVAMGNIAHKHLEKLDIPHLKITHPAARGAIRNKHLYAEHVRSVLLA